jgi:multiple sugar transport system substrate-binding protein
MRARQMFVAAVATIALMAGACTAGNPAGTSSSTTPTVNATQHAPLTLTIWTFFTNPELKQFKAALAPISQTYPWLTVKVVPGKQAEDVLRAINSGTAPDVAMECCPDDSAKYCSTGAWIDLNPYINADQMKMTDISPDGALRYTSYQGKQCALPMLTDAYGLYYNTDLFAKAGITSPPKTYSELLADAKRLTEYNADGSIKVAGFNMLPTGYEISNFENGVWSGTEWYDSAGKSMIGSDPRWAQLFQFQKQMVDTFGYDKLQKWYASVGGADGEFSPSNAFETGKLAMSLDGEWRTNFIDNLDKANVKYHTAPFPVPDDHPELYGAGQIGGTIVGVPKGGAHAGEAWLVVKYLATNTQAESQLAEALGNVPTTFEALKDPNLTSNTNFDTFLKVFANPNSAYKPITPLGTGDVDILDQFVEKYIAGKVSDLSAGLKGVADQIDKQSSLG